MYYLVYLKYNLTKQFSAGPVLNYFIGTNTNFSEIEDGSNSNMMPGLKIAYRLSTEIPMRIDARLITSNNEAKALIALVGFSIGIDINQKLKSESNPNLVKFNSPALKVEIMPPLELEEEKPDLVISLKSARVLFDANAYALDQELEAKLRRLAKYLILNEDQYSKLKISGHTDNRGSRDYNIDLSRNRAESVAKVFIKAGVAGNRVSARGYGYDRPLVSGSKPGALEKNRRTEIEFFGIKNRDRFNKALTDILK